MTLTVTKQYMYIFGRKTCFQNATNLFQYMPPSANTFITFSSTCPSRRKNTGFEHAKIRNSQFSPTKYSEHDELDYERFSRG